MPDRVSWQTFQAFIAEYFGIDETALTATTHLYNELNLDSLGVFSVGLELIKKFGSTLPLAAVSGIETIGDFYTALERGCSSQTHIITTDNRNTYDATD